MADLSYVVEVTGSEKLGTLAAGIEQVTAALSNGKDTAAKLAALKAELKGFGSATDSFKDFGSKFDTMQKTFKSSLGGLSATLKSQGALLNAQISTLGAEISDSMAKAVVASTPAVSKAYEKQFQSVGATIAREQGKLAMTLTEMMAYNQAKIDSLKVAKLTLASRSAATSEDRLLTVGKADLADLKTYYEQLVKIEKTLQRVVSNKSTGGGASGSRILAGLPAETSELKAYYEGLERVEKALQRVVSNKSTGGGASGSRILAGLPAETSELKAYYSELERVARLKLTIQSRTGASATQSLGSTSVASSMSKIDAKDATYASAMSQMKSYYTQIESGNKSVVTSSAGAAAASAKLGTAFKQLTVDGGDAHAMARGLASGFGLLWLTWGNMLPLFAGAALSNGFMQIAKQGMEAAHSLEIIAALGVPASNSIGQTAAEVGSLNSAILELGKSGIYTPVEIAKGMEILSLAGLKVSEVYTAMPTVMALAVAGTTTIANAADVLVSMTTAFGTGAEGFRQASDIIVRAAADSKASVESIGSAMKLASVAGEQYGASMTDVGTMIALLANLGIQGSAAGTSIRNMFVDMSERTPKVAKIMKQFGLDFRDATTGDMKPLIENISQLDAALAKLDGKSGKNLIQNVFSERGGKAAVAALVQYRQAITDADGTTQEWSATNNKLTQSLAAVENSAGDAAIAAAKMEQSTVNAFKGAGASLQTSMYEAYRQVEPQLYQIAISLKEAFSSPTAVAALKNLMELLSAFAVAIAENLKLISVVAAAFAAWKVIGLIASGVSTAFGMLSASLLSVAAPATAASASVTAAGTAAVTAGVASTGAAIGVRTLATSFATLGRFLGPIGLAITALSVGYSIYNYLVGESNSKKDTAALKSDEVVKSLKVEAEKLSTLNNLRSQGLSTLEAENELKERSLRLDAASGWTKPTADAKAELAKASQRLALVSSNDSGGLDVRGLGASALDTAARSKAASDVLKAANEVARLELASQASQSKVSAVVADVKRLGKADAAFRKAEHLKEQQDLKAATEAIHGKGTGTYSVLGNGSPFGGKGRPQQTPFEVDTKELETIKKQMDSRLAIQKSGFDLAKALQDSQHKNLMVSDAQYFVDVLAATAEFEAGSLAILQNSTDEYIREYQKKYAAIAAARDKPGISKDEYKIQSDKGEKIINDMVVFVSSTTAKIEKIQDDAALRVLQTANDAAGRVNKLAKAEKDYWDKTDMAKSKVAALKQIDQQYQYMNTSMFSMAEGEKASAIAILESNAASEERNKTLQDELKLQEDILQALKEMAANPATDPATAIAATAAIATAQIQVLRLGVTAKDSINRGANEGAVAGTEAMNKVFQAKKEKFVTSIGDAITTGIFDGAEAGQKKLRDMLVAALREPINTYVNVVVNSLTGAALNAFGLGGSSGGSGSSILSTGSSLLSGASSLGGLMGSGGVLGTASGAISGFTTALTAGAQSLVGITGTTAQMVTSLTTAGHIAAPGVASGVGAGQAITTALANIGPAGWAAMAVLAVAAIASGRGETRSGAAYGTDANGKAVKLEGPSGGELSGDSVRGMFDATTKGINDMLKKLGSSDTVSAFVAGLESSKAGKGFVYAGGTLSTGAKFGEAGGRNGGEFAFGGQTAEEAIKGYQLQLKQATLQALAAATDIPKSVKEEIAKIDVTNVAESALDDLMVKIDQFAKGIEGMRLAMGLLPMDYLREATYGATAKLVEAAGGLDQLGASLNAYYDKFYTGSEKTANATANLNKAFAAMNIIMPEIDENTRAWYRSEVERLGAMDLNIEANAKAYTSVLSLSGAVDALAPALAGAAAAVSKTLSSLSDARFGLENNLLKLQGKSDEADARIRQADFDKLTEGITDAASLMKIAASYAQNMGLEKTIKNLEEQKGLQEQLNALTDTSAQALTRQRDALDESNRGLFDQVQAATKAKAALDASNAAMQTFTTNLPGTLAKFRTPEQNAAAKYDGLATGIIGAGFSTSDTSTLVALLQSASKEAIGVMAQQLLDGLPEEAWAAKESLRGFADALADIKDAEATANAQKAADDLKISSDKAADDLKISSDKAVAALAAMSAQLARFGSGFNLNIDLEAPGSSFGGLKGLKEAYDSAKDEIKWLLTYEPGDFAGAGKAIDNYNDQLSGIGLKLATGLQTFLGVKWTNVETGLSGWSGFVGQALELEKQLTKEGSTGIGQNLALGGLADYFTSLGTTLNTLVADFTESLIDNPLGSNSQVSAQLKSQGFDLSTLGLDGGGAIGVAGDIGAAAKNLGETITKSLLDSVSESVKGNTAFKDLLSPDLAKLSGIIGGVGKGDVQGLNNSFLLLSGSLASGKLTSAQYTAAIGLVTDAFTKGADAAATTAESVRDAYARLRNPVKTNENIAQEKIGLEDRLYGATDSTAEAAKRAKAAIDPYNQSLYETVIAAEKAKEAFDKVATEKTTLEERLNATASTAEASVRAREAVDALNLTLYDTVIAAEKAKAVATERDGLLEQFYALTDTSTGALDRQALAYDESNRSLFMQIQLLTKEKEVAAELAGLTTQLLTAQGDTIALRNEERAKLDESNRALFDRINYLNDEKAVTAALQTVAQQYKSFVDSVASTKSAVDSASEGITSGYLSAVDAVAAAQEQVNSVTRQAGEAMLGFAKSIREFVDGLDQTEAGGLNKRGQYAAATSDYTIALAQARAGDKDAMSKVAGLAGSMLGLGKETGTSAEDYRILVAQTKGALSELATGAETANAFAAAVDPMLAAQENLAKAQAELVLWNKAISESGASTSRTTADYARDWRSANTAYQAALKDMLTADKLTAGLDMTLGTPIKDLALAISNLAAATKLRDSTGLGVGGIAGAAAGGSVADVVASVSPNRDPAYINTLLSSVVPAFATSGVSSATTAQMYGVSQDDILKYAAANGYPAFANGGYHSGGMRLVGENGPEIEVTGASRIYNAADTANLLRGGGANNTEVVAELRALAARLEAIERNTSATAGHTAKSARQSERVMPGGDAITVRVVA